jgi:hypothetical protein
MTRNDFRAFGPPDDIRNITTPQQTANDIGALLDVIGKQIGRRNDLQP